MKRKSLLFVLLVALFMPWAANAQNTITLTGNVTQTIEPNTTYNFYDSGGPDSNYGTSQNYTATLTCVGDITINFSQFETESSSNCSDWDHMHIYDGNASTGTLLARGQTGCSTATLTTGVDYVASSGTMTIVWKSDGSSVAAGWAATITGGEAPACPKPTDLVCTAYTANTATLSWTENGTATNWVIEYADNANFTGAQTANASGTPSKQLTGLTAETTYYARVKADCGDGDQSDWSNTCEFKPSAVQIVTIGSGSGTNGNLPTNPYYNYSYTQQLYTAAEVGQAGTIKSISFKGNKAGIRTLTIAMVNTDKEAFSSKTDVIPYSDATQVFSGSVTFTANEWKTIELAGDGFDYDGDNLAVIVYDNTNNYTMGQTSWATFTATGNQAVYFYQDASITPSSPSASNNAVTTSKNQIQLGILASSTPKPRNLEVSNITSDGATVTWEAPADNVTGYQYQYKYATTPTWPDTWNTLAANVTHKDLVALAANTLYDFRVRANYAEGDSDPAEIQFTTEATCMPVTNITVSDITSTGAKLAWDDPNGATSWQYLTVAHGDTPDWTSERVITSNTHTNVPANIYACTGVEPQPNTEYDFYVRANCGGGDYSEAAMLTFRTACGAITNFPWQEDFNSYSATASSSTTPSSYPNDEMPGCWIFLNRSDNSSSYPQVFLSSSSDYAVSGNCLFFKSSSTTPLYAVLPEFGNDIAGLELSFTYRNEGTSTSNGTLYVGYMTDPNDASTFNTENAVACAQTTSKTPMNVVLPNAPAGSYFAFKYQGGSSNNYYLAIDNITVKVPVFVTANQIVNTVSDPATEMTWNEFVNHWTNGDHFTSTTFTLMDDINVNTMVGSSANPFTGIFNGNSHTITVNLTATDNNFTAPFRVIKNATIQNLKVNGTINDGGFKFCAGFAGDCYGNNIFTNCESAVTINATIEGDGTHGGFIARNYGSTSSSNLCTTVFNGCAFTGQLLGASTNQVGGFCGWSEYNSPNYAKTIFNNCLFAPQEVTMSTTNSAAFARRRNASYVNFNNCYFMQDFNDGTNNTAQGKQAYTITGVDPVYVAFSGEHTLYNMSGIDAYNEGMILGYTKLAGEGDVVTLTLDGAAGYEANHGTLVANGETFTLTMEAYDTQISGVDCPVPYNVAVPAANLTARSAQVTWTGNSDSYTVQYREVITAPVDVNDTYDFEDNSLQGWTTIDADGHGNAWSRVTSGGYNSSSCMKATYNSSYAHQDYLVSPQITLGGSLSFYAKKGGSFTDTFRVYLSTSGNTSASDFTIELTDGNVEPTTTYTQYTYDLSDYTGMGYVAIVYTAAANQLSLYVDDITITNHIDGEYGAWQTVNNAVSPQALENLTPETSYQVKVSGTCAGVPTDYSDVVEFSTPATCPAPTELAVTDGSVTAHAATITWTENGEATTWIVEYADNADFTGALTETVEDNATYSFDELDGETTYYVRVKAHCGEEDESDYSNVVNFTTLVACQAPTVLTVTATTTTTATLSWTENGTATAWQICLNGDETNLIAANSNPFTLESLTAATSYTVKVRANCGGIDGESAWSNEVSFATECDVITIAQDAAYTYDFENPTPWTCWTNVAGSNDRTSGSNNTTGGSYKLQFKGTTTGNIVAMPAFTPDINGLMLTFWTRPEGYSYSSCGTFSVGYMTDLDDASTFVAVATYDRSDWTSNTYMEKKVAFTSAPAGAYIAFCHNALATNYYWYVDDVTVEIAPTYTLTIEAVGEENWQGGKGGYYLIASPVAENIMPSEDNGFIVGDYDLYYFSQTGDGEGNEWINFKDETFGGFDIVNGTGYLYASKEGTTLTFTGAPYSGDGQVTLTKTANTDGFDGYNLVGNPFNMDAYIEKPFYTLENSDTYTENTAGTAIHAMQGLLVVADNDGDILTFSTEAPAGKSAKLNMNVTKGRAVVDHAIISFNEGQQLPKIQFRNGSTKVYIPQDGKDYAIVSADSNVGEMPVSFKAESNGTYTLSFTNEEVTFNYLHLIDNMTGTETDLLANPSYTFDARTTDYASRFRLVFATGNNGDDDSFAFFSNGSFVINNEGNATLQVIDVTGRILKSESINGSASINFNAAAGVYMLRLVNGENVKVQKVVVK